VSYLVVVYEMDEAADAIRQGGEEITATLGPDARFVCVSNVAVNVDGALTEALAEAKRDDAPLLVSWVLEREEET